MKLGCVLLAAGGSRRLGQPKQLVEINGEALVTRATRNLLSLGTGSVMVVTGSEKDNIMKKINLFPISTVHNTDWEHGMGTSLALGVSSIPSDFHGVLVLLCDQWKVEKNDLRRLVDNWHSDISAIWVSKWGELEKGAFGPPIIFPNGLFSELKTLKGDQGARPIVKKYWDRVKFVDVENAADDLDEPGDLRMLER